MSTHLPPMDWTLRTTSRKNERALMLSKVLCTGNEPFLEPKLESSLRCAIFRDIKTSESIAENTGIPTHLLSKICLSICHIISKGNLAYSETDHAIQVSPMPSKRSIKEIGYDLLTLLQIVIMQTR